MMNGVYQLVIAAYREKVNAKAFFPLDIGIGVGMLIQVAQHGEESILIPVEAAPRMKADIRHSPFRCNEWCLPAYHRNLQEGS